MAMTLCTHLLRTLRQLTSTLLTLLYDSVRFLRLCLCPNLTLAAENLFLRKQLALYAERQVKPRRATNATRLAMVWLSRWFDWRLALHIVKPATFLCWHRQGFRLFWRWKSQPGRPRIPAELQALIRQMARDNPTWGQERIANELLLKLGLQSLREPCVNTCRAIPWEVRANGIHLNAGPRLSAIMPTASSRAISAWRLPRRFAFSMCLWSLNMPAADSCTLMSRRILQLSGPCSSSVKRFQPITRTVL